LDERIRSRPTCGTFQAFFGRFRPRGVRAIRPARCKRHQITALAALAKIALVAARQAPIPIYRPGNGSRFALPPGWKKKSVRCAAGSPGGSERIMNLNESPKRLTPEP
jgi:hypothetical protein